MDKQATMPLIESVQMKVTSDGTETKEYNGKRYVSDKWKVMLKYNGKQFTTPFSQGSGWNGAEPKLNDVLHCLVADYHAFNESEDMESFGHNFGYETEEKEGREELRKVYNQMERSARKLDRFFEPEEIEELTEIFQDY